MFWPFYRTHHYWPLGQVILSCVGFALCSMCRSISGTYALGANSTPSMTWDSVRFSLWWQNHLGLDLIIPISLAIQIHKFKMNLGPKGWKKWNFIYDRIKYRCVFFGLGLGKKPLVTLIIIAQTPQTELRHNQRM